MIGKRELPMDSYKAFYCAGRVTLSGANPYLLEPLRSCEHKVYAAQDFPTYAVEPAPLPAYGIAGLAVLAVLDPLRSHYLFIALLFAAFAATGWALGRVTGFPPALVAIAGLSLWRLSLGFGEIVPFAVAAIALCGLALERKRPIAAGIFAGLAMIQPHVALPLCISLFLFAPRTRVTIVSAAAVLLAIGTLTVGFHAQLGYFTTYLPQQALSEIVASDQYSLTNVLHIAGVPDRAALLFGSLSYLLMVGLGIYAARRLALRHSTPAFLAFAPPAFVLLGGSFVHDLQMFAALPMALLLLARVPRMRPGAALAACLLCIAWAAADSRVALISAWLSVFAVALIIFANQTSRVMKSAVLAVLLVVMLVGVNRLPAPSAVLTTPPGASALSPSAPAAQSWGLLVRSAPLRSEPSMRSIVTKIPTWVTLALLVFAGLAQPTEREKEEEGALTAEPAS